MYGDVQILARTIYGEARGEYGRRDGGIAAFIAVANVVMNRLQQKTWYGHSIREVCQKPWQFSCWNSKDPNYKLLTQEIMDPLYQICFDVAQNVVAGRWPDLTKGSDHYHAISMYPYPKWSDGRQPNLRIGGHLFYRLSKGA